MGLLFSGGQQTKGSHSRALVTGIFFITWSIKVLEENIFLVYIIIVFLTLSDVLQGFMPLKLIHMKAGAVKVVINQKNPFNITFVKHNLSFLSFLFICQIISVFWSSEILFLYSFSLLMTKTQTATTPSSSLKRPSIVTKGNKTHASSRNGPSSIPIKASSTGPRQAGVSTGLNAD